MFTSNTKAFLDHMNYHDQMDFDTEYLGLFNKLLEATDKSEMIQVFDSSAFFSENKSRILSGSVDDFLSDDRSLDVIREELRTVIERLEERLDYMPNGTVLAEWIHKPDIDKLKAGIFKGQNRLERLKEESDQLGRLKKLAETFETVSQTNLSLPEIPESVPNTYDGEKASEIDEEIKRLEGEKEKIALERKKLESQYQKIVEGEFKNSYQFHELDRPNEISEEDLANSDILEQAIKQYSLTSEDKQKEGELEKEIQELDSANAVFSGWLANEFTTWDIGDINVDFLKGKRDNFVQQRILDLQTRKQEKEAEKEKAMNANPLKRIESELIDEREPYSCFRGDAAEYFSGQEYYRDTSLGLAIREALVADTKDEAKKILHEYFQGGFFRSGKKRQAIEGAFDNMFEKYGNSEVDEMTRGISEISEELEALNQPSDVNFQELAAKVRECLTLGEKHKQERTYSQFISRSQKILQVQKKIKDHNDDNDKLDQKIGEQKQLLQTELDDANESRKEFFGGIAQQIKGIDPDALLVKLQVAVERSEEYSDSEISDIVRSGVSEQLSEWYNQLKECLKQGKEDYGESNAYVSDDVISLINDLEKIGTDLIGEFHNSFSLEALDSSMRKARTEIEELEQEINRLQQRVKELSSDDLRSHLKTSQTTNVVSERVGETVAHSPEKDENQVNDESQVAETEISIIKNIFKI